MSLEDQLHYVYTSDVNVSVQVKIGGLEGKLPKPTYEEIAENPSLQHCTAFLQTEKGKDLGNLLITCQVYIDGRSLGIPIQTSYKAFTSRWNWNEWLTLPVKYPELGENAQLAFTIWDIHEGMNFHAIGGTTIQLFSKRGVFRRGMMDLKIYPFQEADGSFPTKTPGKLKKMYEKGEGEEVGGAGEMGRLEKLRKRHRSGLMEKVDWLDRMTFREIEMINEAEKRDTNHLFLMVEFPRVHYNNQDHLLVLFEKNGEEVFYHRPYPAIVTCPDPELGLENLCEAKHNDLGRTKTPGLSDSELKPNAQARDQLERIIQLPPSYELNGNQKDLVWKFRYYLLSNKKALSKFLQSVNWMSEGQVKEGVELMKSWAPMDVEDALELLSADYTNKAVRGYAVSRLRDTSVQDVILYLLQLVQALKYEDFQEIETGIDASFLQQSSGMWESTEESGEEEKFAERSDLATFLISSACKNPTLANYLFWYLKVESESCVAGSVSGGVGGEKELARRAQTRQMYLAVMRRLSKALLKGGMEARRRRTQLMAQQTFVSHVVHVMEAVAKESGNRRKKIECLQSLLSTQDSSMNFNALDSLPLPLDPDVKIESVVSERASLFNSNLMPCKLTFRTNAGRDYVTIFKRGDDLRQDQLVIQMIRLMDKLLRAENLDMKLTPYNVLPTSLSEGFLQFVESHPLRDVLADWNSVQEFFRFYRPSAKGPDGIESDVMENYVRSCAGYSVISYVLGIGDRHLHNLLICKNGKLFHVDFGFILGRDPKPFPPPMKLTREMIDGMGGLMSPQWQEFRRLCYTVFLHLRRHANLILNLFGLMVNSGITDIAAEPDKAVKKIEQRFHLNLNDEEAVTHMQRLIDASISAKMAVLSDWAHDWAHAISR